MWVDGIRSVTACLRSVGETCGLPPIQCFNASEPQIINEVFDAFRDDGDWGTEAATAHLARDGAERGAVEVVHVRVRKQDCVDRRQVGNANARSALAPKQDEAGCENRVDKQGASGGLDEERRVSDEGDGGLSR